MIKQKSRIEIQNRLKPDKLNCLRLLTYFVKPSIQQLNYENVFHGLYHIKIYKNDNKLNILCNDLDEKAKLYINNLTTNQPKSKIYPVYLQTAYTNLFNYLIEEIQLNPKYNNLELKRND